MVKKAPSRNPCALITCSLASLPEPPVPKAASSFLRLNRRRSSEGGTPLGDYVLSEAKTKNGAKTRSLQTRTFPIHYLLFVPKLLPPSQRALFRLGAGSIGGSVLRKRVCLQVMPPEVDRWRGGLPSQLRQLRLHTRPSEDVRDGSVLPIPRDAWRPGIGSQLLLCGNPPEKFLVAVHLFLPASRR
jgi:hypothetical protein